MINLVDFSQNIYNTIAELSSMPSTGGNIGRCEICGNEFYTETEADTGVCHECSGEHRHKEADLVNRADGMRKEPGNG